MLIVSIEVMLLAVTLVVLIAAHDYGDASGQTYAAVVIAVAAAESAVGLGVLVAYYRLRLRGRALGATGAQLVATLSVVATALLSIVAFYEVALGRSSVTVTVGTWLDSDPLYAAWAFTYDDLTVAMLLPVTVVSSCVHVYSMSYMADDPHTQRFFSYLAFFTASMVLLVTGDSYATIFLGWELIGVASYLLIGFWLTRAQAQKSAIKAMTVNRVGDMILSIGLFAVLWALGSIEHATVLASAPMLNETVVTALGLLLLGGAMSKSAQLPLHSWLADSLTSVSV
nr:NADH dehydrogenase subunit 5, mitochondrial [Tanacetum cinerariifolium]